jgi:hypothetical protein
MSKTRRSAHSAALLASAIASDDPQSRGVSQAGLYTIPKVEAFLGSLKERAKILNPLNKGQQVMDWIDGALESINKDGWMQEKSQVTIAASRGDREAMEIHAANVEIVTENVLLATAGWLSFFEERQLGETDIPVINSEIGMEMTIDTIGQDGGNLTIRAQRENTQAFVPLNMRASRWIEYPLVDVYKGSQVKELALSQFDVGRDRAYKTDSLLASYLIAGGTNSRLTATFTTTGPKLARDYVAHSRVNVDNLPAGNLITLSGNTTTSLFRKEVFDKIIAYSRSWGDGIFNDGDIMPVEIRVPSKDVTNFLEQVTITSQSNMIVDQVFQGGMIMSYGGYKWIIIGDNTLRPNDGMAYVRCNKPIGVYFTKPSLAKAIVDESASLQQQNKGRTCEIWCEGFGMPRHWRKHTLGVRYRTAS